MSDHNDNNNDEIEWPDNYPSDDRLINRETRGGEFFGYDIKGFDPDKGMPGKLI